MIPAKGRDLASSEDIKAEERALKIKNIRCEYRVNPLGVDALRPRLSWELSSSKRGVIQESDRILVASSFHPTILCLWRISGMLPKPTFLDLCSD